MSDSDSAPPTPDSPSARSEALARPNSDMISAAPKRIPAVLGVLALAVVSFAVMFSQHDVGPKIVSPAAIVAQEQASRPNGNSTSEQNAGVRKSDGDHQQQSSAPARKPAPGKTPVPRLDPKTGSSLAAPPKQFEIAVLEFLTPWVIMALIFGSIYELWRAIEKRLYFWIILASFGLLTFLVGHRIDCIPLQSIGWLVASIAILIVLHRNHQKRFRGTGVLIGLSFGMIAFCCAIIGIRYRIDRATIAEGPIEATSVAAYEATQALMMNMAPHDPYDEQPSDVAATEFADVNEQAKSSGETIPGTKTDLSGTQTNTRLKDRAAFDAERVWFTASRIFASLFALFIAYQALTRFARNSVYRFRLLLLRYTTVNPKTSLVCGVGRVGLRLVRELRDQGHSVIALETNSDHPNLQAAIETGAIVLVCNATQPESLNGLPLNAIKEMFIVCGDDTVNVEAAMNLKHAVEEFQNVPVGWPLSLLRSVAASILHSSQPSQRTCHVQVLEPEMQAVLKLKFRENNGNHQQPLEFIPFNADLNAVRNLITDDLTPERPKEIHEVAFYIVVGFDNRWEEVVLALGQMAHFENRKRSRILVLTADPGRDAKVFRARYPRFTIDNCVQLFWNNVNFCAITDEWSSTFAGASTGRTEAKYRDFAEPEIKRFVRLLVPSSQPFMDKLPAPAIVSVSSGVCLREAAESTIARYANNTTSSGDPAARWYEVEGYRECVDSWLSRENILPEHTKIADSYGLEFATQTLFSRLPDVASDDDFLSLLHRLIDAERWSSDAADEIVASSSAGVNETPDLTSSGPLKRIVKPSLIVAGRDDNQNFTWANTFAQRWMRFRARHGVSPPAIDVSKTIPDVSVFVWISNQQPLRLLMQGNAIEPLIKVDNSKGKTPEPANGVLTHGCRSFGDPKQTASLSVIGGNAFQFLAKAAEEAYEAVRKPPTDKSATSASPVAMPPAPALTPDTTIKVLQDDPERFDHQQSNMHAAEHASIKLAMMLHTEADIAIWKSIVTASRSYQWKRNLAELYDDGLLPTSIGLQSDGHALQIDKDSARLAIIAEVEHNRWSAELLLRNAMWKESEPKKLTNAHSGKNARTPEAMHIRKTLCPWDQLDQNKDEAERQKDIDQTWYVLLAFKAMLEAKSRDAERPDNSNPVEPRQA